MSFLARPARAFALAALLATTGLATLPASAADLTILLMNDIDQMGGRPAGGYDRISGVVAAERAKVGKETGTLLVMHGGDALSPSLMSGFDKGAHIVDLINAIGVDYFVPGNHEFDFGQENFLAQMAKMKPKKLGANITLDGAPLPGFIPTDMIEVDGVKIGIVGAAFDGTPEVSSPGTIAFADTVGTVEARAKELKANGADMVIALVHAERGQDIKLGRSGAVDIVLSGHDQDLYVNYDEKAVIAEALDQGDQLVAIDIDLKTAEKDGKRKVTWEPTFRIVSTAGVEPEPTVGAEVKKLEAELSKELDVVIGKTDALLDSRRATVRTGEALIGNVIADGMRTATKADVAITNGGGIRGNKTYAAGSDITRRDILSELPFGNRTVVVAISGADLKAALENGVSRLPDPEGRFPQVSGLAFTVDPAQPAGSRVSGLTVNGKPVDPAATYTVATNDFMLRGGDGYTPFIKGKVLVGPIDGKLMAGDAMAEVRTRGTITAGTEPRITVK